MSDTTLNILAIAIPSIISIIGFIITSIHLSKSFKNEILKQKNSITLSKIIDAPYLVLDFFTKPLDKEFDQNILFDKMVEFQNLIYGYGSATAIKILSSMQEHSYKVDAMEDYDMRTNEKFKTMSFYSILVSQLKYDITGEIINPNYWFKMKITDYDDYAKIFKDNTNKIISDLNLNPAFKIK